MEKLDKTDKILLGLLTENARCGLKELAEKVFLSPPAVSARIQRLEKMGVITGYGAKLNLSKLGFHITAFINLALKPIQKPEFYPYIESVPNVLECSCVTGPYSMLIKVAFQSTDDLDRFIGELQKFGPTETQIVFCAPVASRELQVFDDGCKEYLKRSETDVPT